MSKGRKTMNVEKMVIWANKQLCRTDEYSNKDGFKDGIAHMIEMVLHQSGNYNGYYIDSIDNPYQNRFYFFKKS
tara:strand:- start:89 stop:310 length:222 start_codon:yes stop_codon:yes gene_type:complete